MIFWPEFSKIRKWNFTAIPDQTRHSEWAIKVTENCLKIDMASDEMSCFGLQATQIIGSVFSLGSMRFPQYIDVNYQPSLGSYFLCSFYVSQSNFMQKWCKIRQHYVIKLYNIIQYCIIRGNVSPHIRRLIVVNDRFCGDNCP